MDISLLAEINVRKQYWMIHLDNTVLAQKYLMARILKNLNGAEYILHLRGDKYSTPLGILTSRS